MLLQSHRKWLIFLFLTLFSVWFSGYIQREMQNFRASDQKDLYDFHVYYIAGQVARSSTDKRLYSYKEIPNPENPSEKIIVNPQLQPFNPDTTYGQFVEKENSDAGQYLYPPFFSLAISPLTYLSYDHAKLLWHIFVFLLVAGSVIITVRLLYDDYLTIALVSGVAIVIAEFSFPVRDLLLVGNLGSLILFLTVAGIYLHKKYPAFGALFFALAVIIKLTPIVVVPLMIIRKQWKWLIAFCCWGVLLWGVSIWQLGWQNHQEFFTRVMPAMAAGIPQRDNKSLSTAIYGISEGKFLTSEEIHEGAYIFPKESQVLLFKIATALSFCGLLFLLWRFNKGDSHLHIEIFLVTLWSILFAPVSFKHYYLLALAPIVYAWLHPLTKKASTVQLIKLSAATFMMYSVLPVYGFVLTDSFPIHFLVFLVMPAGALLCMLYLMMILRSQNELPSESN